MSLALTESYGCTPLLKLRRFGKEHGAHLYAKQESRNPMGSVKCRIAVAMIEQGIKDGLINDDTVIIEPTSGNTGIGLAFVCASKGLRNIFRGCSLGGFTGCCKRREHRQVNCISASRYR